MGTAIMSDNMERMLDQDVKRLEGLIIPVIIKTEDTVTRVFLNGKDPLGPQLLDFLGVSGGKVQAFYRGELDNEATVEDSGIDAEATLMVRLMVISFEEVAQDLVSLNPTVTEEKAKSGAKRDADGNLIEWKLSYLPIKELPESISGCVALKELRCRGCMNLQSLGGIGSCTALQTLNCFG